MKEVTVPDIGNLKDVEIIEILVGVGDAVLKEQPLVIIESDKATMEILSPEAGIVATVAASVGNRASKGFRLLTLEAGNPRAECPAPLATITGARVQLELAPQISDASAAEVPVLADLPAFVPETVVTSEPVRPRVYAGPAVRKIAHDLGVNLREINGSGPRGRILAQDVRRHIRLTMNVLAARDSSVGPTLAEPVPLPPWPKVDYAAFGPVESQQLSRIRRITGANLHRNWVTIPHVTNHDDADVTELEAFRAELNEERGSGAIRISPLAFLVKACAATLRQFPQFNASLEGDAVILKRYFHIGFAADTPHGLVVPVIPDADEKGVLQIAEEMAELSAKARNGKLSIPEMQGGSFSISSLGGIGGSYFTPIINAPEVAILGVGKIQTRAVWVEDKLMPRLLLPLSLSWDHRVIDGAAAARFNVHLSRLLADLRRLLL